MNRPDPLASFVSSSVFLPFESKRSTPKFKHPAMIAGAEPATVDYMWWLYHNLPRQSPRRFARVHRAAVRLMARRATSILPPHTAFASTVDYYEAILPLMRARHVFRRHFFPGDYFLSLDRALRSILPDQLF